MSSSASDGTGARDHVVAGPFRRPYNDPSAAPGSIHDDRTAQELGFRAGTVAGAVHMEQFPPLLERVLGADWPRTGGLSLYFVRPTASGEPVRCLADDRPSGAHHQIRVWMEDEHGEPICEGSASVAGTDPDSVLRRRLATLRPPRDLRILAGVEVGRECAAIPVRVERRVVDARRQFITEPLPGFDGTARGIELPVSAAVDALRAVEKALVPLEEAFVGMFGAIELQYLDGPVFAETDYVASGRILALAETPRSECVWYSSRLDSARDGRPVAEMIMMSRLLKQSSSRWQG